MLKENKYPVLAPSRIPATGGNYRNLEDNPVGFTILLYSFYINV